MGALDNKSVKAGTIARWVRTGQVVELYDLAKRSQGMDRQQALEAFFGVLDGWFEKPVKYDRNQDGTVAVWFNNEYAIALPLDVVMTLWPDAIEDHEP